MVDLNLLAVLDAILQTGSVGKAAPLLELSKPAMSHALARLRAEIGDPVLVRAGQRWVLTERAELLRPKVHALVSDARKVLAPERAPELATLRRTFRIHATDIIVSLLGVALGEAIARTAPDVDLRLLPVQPEQASHLRDGDVDLAIGHFPDLPPEFRTQVLFRDGFACVVRKGHPRVTGRMSLETFVELDHVLVAPRGKLGGPVDDALRERGLSRRVARTVPYFLAALDLVSRSDAVVMISRRLAHAQASRFRLQVLKPPIRVADYSVSQIWHPKVDRDAAHTWLRKTVVAVARDAGE